jgi:3-oxoacyl-[acyl-carrier protein] reductase
VDLGLKQQVAFVAGSSRGIGRAIAEALLAEGACVVLTGRDEASLNDASKALETSGYRERLLPIHGDFSDGAVIEAAFAQTVRHFGRIDHLVANLGSGRGAAGWEHSEEEWRRLFEHNLFASIRLTQAVLPRLLSNSNGGSILYIASIAGVQASAAPLPYSAAKAALINYSKNLARQLGPQKVRVNTVAPGNVLFAGGTWQARMDSEAAGVQQMLMDQVPQRRFGTPGEIAALAAFLCSVQAAFTTGGCFVVDGGQTRSI